MLMKKCHWLFFWKVYVSVKKKMEGYRSQNKLQRKPLDLRVDWCGLEIQSIEMANCYLISLCLEKQIFISLKK